MLILGAIGEAIVSAGIWITVGIYKVAALVFELFLILASGKLLDTASYSKIITNFYLIIGIVMLFVLAFSLLKGMINSDDQQKSATSVKKIIINIITSAILMAVLPIIFTFLYDFQDAFIVEQNTIGKFFGYGTVGSDSDSPSDISNLNKVKSGAYQIVNGVYTAFFNVNVNECDATGKGVELLSNCQVTAKPNSGEEKTVTLSDGKKKLENLKDTIDVVNSTGAFGLYSSYTEAADDGIIDFNFLMCLIGGALLVYVGISYCFDMALRLVKLVFYQLMAPIPIFLRIVPEGKLSGTFNQWLKITLTCYMEVFVRIFIFYFCVYLCQEMLDANFLSNEVYNYGIFVGLLAKAFILMGIITFMKQAPKLISDITGLDSGNMKLGIKDKLAAGGAFTAGAIVGGGLSSGIKNFTNRIDKNKWAATKELTGKDKFKARAKILGQTAKSAGTWGSVIAGGASGAVRSGKAGMGAKSWGDMTKSAGSGAKGAVDARDSRAAYKASHGGTVRGAMLGHIKDIGRNIGEWAGAGVGDANLGYYTTAAQSTNSFNDLSESTYKKKQEYMDQSSVVKALKAQLDADEQMPEGAEGKLSVEARKELKAKYNRETAALVELQKTMATKKKDVISIAATRLSVDQHSKYSHDQQFIEAYENAIYEGFKVSAEDFKRSRIEERVEIINGNEVTTKQRIFFDEAGNETKVFNSSTTQMFDAMLAGGEIKDEWINQDNVILIQDAIDKANIGRQHIKTQKEREHIVNTGNRSTEKKDN